MAKATAKLQPVNSANLAQLESAVGERQWSLVLDLVEGETNGGVYADMLMALGRIGDQKAKDNAWGDAAHCYHFAMWPITHPSKIRIPEAKNQELMMGSYQLYMKLPDALQKANKQPGFWDSVGDEVVVLALAGRFKNADELLQWAFSGPKLKRGSYAAAFEASADKLTLPEQQAVIVWLLGKATEEARNSPGKRDEEKLQALRDQRDGIAEFGQAVKELRDLSLVRRPEQIEHVLSTKYGTIGPRLAKHFSGLGAGDTSDALEMRAIGAQASGDPAEASRLRETALGLRMRQFDEWMKAPAEDVADPSDWHTGIARQERLALAGRFDDANALLKRLKKLPQPPSDTADPRVVGARFHEEIGRHLKTSHQGIAGWFASNARALQAHSERDPDNPEPELADAVPQLEEILITGQIKALVELARGPKFGEIVSEIAQYYEDRAADHHIRGEIALARALYRIAKDISYDTHQIYRINHIVDPLVVAEADRKLWEIVSPEPAASDWWSRLDRVEHLALAGRFEEADAMMASIKQDMPDAVSLWAGDWNIVARHLDGRPRESKEEDDPKMAESEERWISARVSWFEAHIVRFEMKGPQMKSMPNVFDNDWR